MEYIPTIGLEIHVELKTKTKMFCDSLNDPNEKHPNINICPICISHPGTLPVINQEAVKKVIMVGLALGGEIPEFSQFDRKNYFYPDLPKGYQISQYQHPLIKGGYLEIPTSGSPTPHRRIRIQRIHLEEDTGRLLHDEKTKTTLVDFNRAGIPLMELVTEPDITSAGEARAFAEELQRILQYLDASDADMEKGEMRIEANVSLAPTDSPTLGTKVELKNINSFRFVERAIQYEVGRQRSVLEAGGTVKQETRGWDEKSGKTLPQRTKEESHDYRYFPEPDLPPLNSSPEEIEALSRSLPELPAAKRDRFIREFGIQPKLAETLAAAKDLAAFFEASVSELKEWLSATGRDPGDPLAMQLAANYLTSDLLRHIRETGDTIPEMRITPENFAELITYLVENRISSAAAKTVLAEMYASGADPSLIIEERGLWQVTDAEALGRSIEKVLHTHPAAVADFKRGKMKTLQFLLGQVMKEARGANPEVLRKLLEEKLK